MRSSHALLTVLLLAPLVAPHADEPTESTAYCAAADGADANPGTREQPDGICVENRKPEGMPVHPLIARDNWAADADPGSPAAALRTIQEGRADGVAGGDMPVVHVTGSVTAATPATCMFPDARTVRGTVPGHVC